MNALPDENCKAFDPCCALDGRPCCIHALSAEREHAEIKLAALQQLGHEGIDVRDIGMGGAADVDIAYAKAHRLVLLTRDLDFSDVRNYPPAEYAGIVVLQLQDDAVAQTVVKVPASFVAQSELMAKVPGRLAIVEPWRVRFRPGLA